MRSLCDSGTRAVCLRDAFAGVADDELIVFEDARGLKIGFRVGCLKDMGVRSCSFLLPQPRKLATPYNFSLLVD
jgi:hypothetical protein